MDDGVESGVSSYLRHLPAVFQEVAPSVDASFLGRFLLAFEAVLSGLDEGDVEGRVEVEVEGAAVVGLDQQLDHIDSYFDPDRVPEEFLPWLASWVGLTLRDDWSPDEQRRFLGRVVSLYRRRGTKAGLEEMLRTYTGMGVEIAEFAAALRVGEVSTVGVDTVIGGGPPHYFEVRVLTDERDPEARARVERIARAIIDQERPAHTHYALDVETPTMQVGVFSTVGVDTLLGHESDND